MELSKSEVSKIVKQLRAQPQEGGFLPPVLVGLGVAGLTALVSELGKLMAPIIADKARKVLGSGVKLSGQGLMLTGPAPKRSAKPRATVVELSALEGTSSTGTNNVRNEELHSSTGTPMQVATSRKQRSNKKSSNTEAKPKKTKPVIENPPV